MIYKTKNKKSGFTLVEMMVAVSIFVIVAFIVVSTLLTMSYAYKKAQVMRLLMDNLGFSIQSMSLNIREGVGYSQDNCSIDKGCFQLNPIDSWLDHPANPGTVCYDLYDRGSSKGIRKCDKACPCGEEGSDIISPEIDITKLSFIVSEPLVNQNKVKILISGKAGKNPREATNFFIQNTVSQRNANQ